MIRRIMPLNSLYKIILAMLLGWLLASCAVDQAKPVEEEAVVAPDVPQEVDEEIEEDFDRALSYLKDKEYDKAIELLESILKTEKRFAAPFVNLGMAYAHKGDKKQAEKNYRAALDIDLGHAVANNELGQLYRKAGRFDDARKAYENALAVHEDYLPARRNLGILCDLYLRDLNCALEHYELYQKYAPDDKNIAIWIADLKRRLGR